MASGGRAGKKDGTPSLHLMRKLECRICPLDKIKENEHPHMKPTGASEPLVYVLGEAPGKAEDAQGKHFVGKSGKLLRARLPANMLPFIRFNNVVRTRPIDNETPERVPIEACRPSIERDIVASKPRAIFGFGNVPLQWALQQSGVYRWRGRRIPVDIAGHVCWFYPFTHPAALLRTGKRAGRHGDNMRPDEIGSEDERAFVFDLKRAFSEVEELPEPRVYSQADVEAGVEIIPCTEAGLARLAQFLTWAKSQHVVGLDIETNKKRPYATGAKILSVAIGTEKWTVAFALDHREATWTKKQRRRVDELLLDFLGCPAARKAVHQLGFDIEWLGVFYGAHVLRAGHWEDTLQQAAALDERFGERKCFALDFLCLQYFGFHLKAISNLDRKNLNDEPLDIVLKYNAYDAKFHCLLFLAQRERLEAEGLQKVYQENNRSVPTLVLSQIKGVTIDQGENTKLKDEYEAAIAQALDDIMAIPGMSKFKNKHGEKFNPTSNEDVAGYLHHIGCHDFESVDEEELLKIDHEIVEPLLRLRKASKVLSTYITPYTTGSPNIWPDGKIHTCYSAFGTLTNRTASEEPNTQNTIKRDPKAKRVRKMFKAPLVISIDYGQIQPRGIAMASKDKALVKSMWDRHDIHMEWAEIISRAYPKRIGGKQNFTDKKVMKDFRQVIKAWDLQLFFGATLESSSNEIEVPIETMRPIYERFWNTFPGVKDWQDDLIATYEKKGIVKHLDGRLNRAPISLNQVINYPIQGVERQIVMNAMNKLSEYATETGDLNYQPNLMIHDDLTTMFEEQAAIDHIDDYIETIVTKMLEIDFAFINVPLTVEVSMGEDMYDMSEVLVASSDTWRK